MNMLDLRYVEERNTTLKDYSQGFALAGILVLGGYLGLFAIGFLCEVITR